MTRRSGNQGAVATKALHEAGVSAKAYAAKGKDHGSINNDLGLPDDRPTKALFEFVDGALKKR
jgi:hypothetical protein